ncbi:MAG: ABC transporter ATP-binding protein [Anaerolineae bacterium]|nr:ABC transporter ATP-binding protein [Anaerolineae bacterium]
MAEVRIENLVKVFPNGTRAVNDVSLAAPDGEFLVLLGPSGCGKTTTLRCVAGLERQTSGDIYIGERVVNDLPPGERDIAFVFQFYALYPHLSAYDNIAFPLRAVGVAADEIDRRVMRVAETLRIKHVLRKRPRSMSSGEQQRVALGRAVIRRPQVFLMDEPLTNLDAALRSDMRVELKHLQRELGVTTLYVTHDQTEAMTMGERIAVMQLGDLQQVGTPLEVYQYPATLFVASFIGDPPMNLIPVTLEGDALQGASGHLSLALAPDVAGAIRQKQSGPGLVLGVRAEDITLSGGDEGDMRGEVTTREPLGDQALYSVGLDGQFIQITTAPTTRFGVGDAISLSIDRSRMRVFDAATERALV